MLKKILKSNAMLAVFFVYCLPLSIFMMYKYKNWKDVWKIVLGGVGVFILSFVVLGIAVSGGSSNSKNDADVKKENVKKNNNKVVNVKKEQKNVSSDSYKIEYGGSNVDKIKNTEKVDLEDGTISDSVAMHELEKIGNYDTTLLSKRSKSDALVSSQVVNPELARRYFKEVTTIYLKKSYEDLKSDTDIIKLSYKVRYVQVHFRDIYGRDSDGYRYLYYYSSMLNNLLIYPDDATNAPLAKSRREKSEYYLYLILKDV